MEAESSWLGSNRPALGMSSDAMSAYMVKQEARRASLMHGHVVQRGRQLDSFLKFNGDEEQRPTGQETSAKSPQLGSLHELKAIGDCSDDEDGENDTQEGLKQDRIRVEEGLKPRTPCMNPVIRGPVAVHAKMA